MLGSVINQIKNNQAAPAFGRKIIASTTIEQARKNVEDRGLPLNLTAADLKGRVQVAMNSKPSRMPKEVTARHILVDSEQEALKIRDEILKGKTFAAAALEYSKCPSKNKGGDLGSFTPDKMVRPFSEVAFKLPPHMISDPVKTDFGYHLILVTGQKF